MATVKAIKTPLWGFLSIALIFAPVLAQTSASATQPPDQSVTQEGNENFVMQGNVQVGIVNQRGGPACLRGPISTPCPPP